MVNIDRLRSFYHVVKEGSYIRAALVLGKSRSAISLHLSNLQKDCGERLISIVKKKVILSEKGEELFRLAQEIIPQIDGPLEAFFSGEQKKKRRSLKVVTTTGAIGVWLVGKLQKFQEKFSEIEVSVITINDSISFLDSIGDVGILQKVSEPGVFQRKVLTVKTRLYASKGYIAKYGSPKSLKDLENHKLISFYSGCGANFGNIDWHTNRGMPPGQVRPSLLRLNSVMLLFDALRRGLGIVSLNDQFEFLKRDDIVQVLPKEEPQNFGIYYMTRKDRPQSEEEEALYRILAEEE
jgi:DNA-binding transcriptional LysR family regulator